MAQISFDQSHIHHCHIHGKRSGGYFIRPDANEHFAAFYICSHRPTQLGFDLRDRSALSREEAIDLEGGCTKEG